MKVEFIKFTNDAHREAAEKALRPSLCLLPTWVETVNVWHQNYENEGIVAEARAVLVSRGLCLSIYFDFYDWPEQQQRHFMRHEICHAITNPLWNFAREYLLDPIEEKNPDLYKALDSMLREKLECCTEDLANVFDRIIGDAH